MAKVTPKEAEKLQKMREAQKYRKEEAERKANPPYYKTTWFRVVLVLVVLTIATSFYDYNGGRGGSKAFKKRGASSSSSSSSSKSAAASSKLEEEDSVSSSASASGKKRRVYIEREEWERQMRDKETPTGEPRDLYPKYVDMLSSVDGAKVPKPEVYLRQKLYQLGRAYQLAEVEQEKQLSKDGGAVAVDIGLHSYIADGAKVLTEIEQNFAYAVEVLKRDKKGVGKIDLTEVLFDCVDSIHQNVRVLLSYSSSFLFLFVMSLSLSYTTYCCLLAFSDTTRVSPSFPSPPPSIIHRLNAHITIYIDNTDTHRADGIVGQGR